MTKTFSSKLQLGDLARAAGIGWLLYTSRAPYRSCMRQCFVPRLCLSHPLGSLLPKACYGWPRETPKPLETKRFSLPGSGEMSSVSNQTTSPKDRNVPIFESGTEGGVHRKDLRDNQMTFNAVHGVSMTVFDSILGLFVSYVSSS